MSESAAHTFFAIPELLCLLSTYVETHDLTQCILVCRDWSRQFQPRLWVDFDIDDCFINQLKTVPSTMALLTKHLGQIRAVNFWLADDTRLQLLIQGLPLQLNEPSTDPGTLCTNLQCLILQQFDETRLPLISMPLVTLLGHNPCLTRLEMSCVFFEIDGAPAALAQLSHLQHLYIFSYNSRRTITNPVLLLQSCLALPELTELRFVNMETCWDDGYQSTNMHEVEAVINRASNARIAQGPAVKRIKTLQLPSHRQGHRNPLPLLFLKSSLLDLETCEIPWFRPDADLEEIEQVVREHCPNLKHLTCPFFFGLAELAEAMRAFIRGCSGLQSFSSEGFNDGYDLAPMLILSELVARHHTTLETLELPNAFEVRSRDLQEVLSCCKQLKRFWVICNQENHMLSGLAFQDISRSDWVCTELRELGIALNRCRCKRNISGELEEEEKQDDPRVWLAASATKRAYQQIGRLEKLEVLAIDTARGLGTMAKAKDYLWDLTLSKGWLGEMAGLKNLRRLELRADFLSMMGQAEVEFMYDYWPELREISFPCKIEHIHAEPHWQWLLYNLPQLTLSSVEEW
ncbi:hypothetical protein BGZ70_000923 [Mortierella alpina]|uniref:F-box domain-containing protein n=1 Tax=Mortierella alpina TaxID=64518 RepID=A0A9P6LY40_MORAP|nr:hypothetical protein BGZ70_000923 [Mortierella alpina]